MKATGRNLGTTVGTSLYRWMPEWHCSHLFVANMQIALLVNTMLSTCMSSKVLHRSFWGWLFLNLTACNAAYSCYLCTSPVGPAVCSFCVSVNICLMLSWNLDKRRQSMNLSKSAIRRYTTRNIMSLLVAVQQQSINIYGTNWSHHTNNTITAQVSITVHLRPIVCSNSLLSLSVFC